MKLVPKSEMNVDLPPVLTLKDAAAYLQRCTKTVRTRIKSGEIKSYKEGQAHRIKKEWILEYEQSLIKQGGSV